MRACMRTHQSLYERHFGGPPISVNTVAFLSHGAASGDTGTKREFFYSLVRHHQEMRAHE